MSLADEIAQMLDPRPAAEPGEDEDIDGAFALGNLHEESYEQPPEPKKGRKPRMRAAIDLGSSAAKYAGRVVSRERLAREQRHETKQQSASEDEDDEDDDGEEEDDEEEEDIEDDEDEDDEGDDDDNDDDDDEGDLSEEEELDSGASAGDISDASDAADEAELPTGAGRKAAGRKEGKGRKRAAA